MGLFRRDPPPKPTIIDAVGDKEWDALTNAEQRLLYVIERFQKGRTTHEEYLRDLEWWRKEAALGAPFQRVLRARQTL